MRFVTSRLPYSNYCALFISCTVPCATFLRHHSGRPETDAGFLDNDHPVVPYLFAVLNHRNAGKPLHATLYERSSTRIPIHETFGNSFLGLLHTQVKPRRPLSYVMSVIRACSRKQWDAKKMGPELVGRTVGMWAQFRFPDTTGLLSHRRRHQRLKKCPTHTWERTPARLFTFPTRQVFIREIDWPPTHSHDVASLSKVTLIGSSVAIGGKLTSVFAPVDPFKKRTLFVVFVGAPVEPMGCGSWAFRVAIRWG